MRHMLIWRDALTDRSVLVQQWAHSSIDLESYYRNYILQVFSRSTYIVHRQRALWPPFPRFAAESSTGMCGGTIGQVRQKA